MWCTCATRARGMGSGHERAGRCIVLLVLCAGLWCLVRVLRYGVLWGVICARIHQQGILGWRRCCEGKVQYVVRGRGAWVAVAKGQGGALCCMCFVPGCGVHSAVRCVVV